MFDDDNDLEEWGRNESFEDSLAEQEDEPEEDVEERACTCNAPGGYCDCPGAPRAPSIWER